MTGKKNNDQLQNKEIETTTDQDDFVMVKKGGKIISGGFDVNSILLKHNQSLMYTLNRQLGGGLSTDVSDLFKDLAVPAGIFYQPSTKIGSIGGSKQEKNVIGEEEVDDDLYEKLVKLASIQQESSREKKQRKETKSARSKDPNRQKFTKKNKVNK